ncbi:hypothetical protein [Streptococcus halotolerans]|uniref:hypothetical protein n=1 Tax=Streptococcus halotolerans TaxID=1814128 RepID=UPI000787A36A|nr:hypothetical protein [Streptococcus halotolerans]
MEVVFYCLNYPQSPYIFDLFQSASADSTTKESTLTQEENPKISSIEKNIFDTSQVQASQQIKHL